MYYREGSQEYFEWWFPFPLRSNEYRDTFRIKGQNLTGKPEKSSYRYKGTWNPDYWCEHLGTYIEFVTSKHNRRIVRNSVRLAHELGIPCLIFDYRKEAVSPDPWADDEENI